MAKKIKIEGDLYGRLAKYSEVAGYSTADEFIVHVLEKSVADMEKTADEESHIVGNLDVTHQ